MTHPPHPSRRARIDAIVAEAWRQPPDQRAAFVAGECGADVAMRAEVEALLVAGDEAVVEPATPQALDPGAWPLPFTPARVGPYDVERELARGGMGVVLRARDSRLGRVVALKALPAEFARHPAALARFRREARALASVTHPNVAVLHDLHEHAGLVYLVMEMVDGPTLRERLRRGPLPVAEALSVGAQIAAGLGAAHEQGVIHRDLKPENVKLTPRGTAKVLDFGVAKLAAIPDVPGEVPAPRPSPADSAALTQRGAFIGTPGYGAPEQVRAEAVDAGADLFALGCVLFECLSGRPAFPGRTPAERGHHVLASRPDWEALPAATPTAVRELLQSCLAKSRATRPASADDVRGVLERAIATHAWEERPARTRDAPAGNLPSALTAFVGRGRELARLRAALAQGRLVTLTGVGGAGKTRLALEAARTLAATPEGGTWLVELAGLTTPEIVPAHVAAALGARIDAGGGPLEALARCLQGRDTLIVLDNCEHLLAAAGDLASHLLRAAPGLRILATSREPLGVPGEQILVVPSLSLPAADDADPRALQESEAVALFVERARLVRPDFRVDETTARHVALACRRLDGIPLALELAAARLRHLGIEELARRLEDRFGLLTGGARGALPRQQALQATMDWSHDLLSADERILYRRLAVFAGGFRPEDAAIACAGDGLAASRVADLLVHLADKSLLIADDTGARMRMLETVQQHAHAKLFESGELPVLRTRHAGVFVELAERALAPLDGPEQSAWLARLDAERDNLRAALDWLQACPDTADLQLRLAVPLWNYWDIVGAWAEGHDRLAAAIARAPADTPPSRLTSALRGVGWFSRQLGDLAAARSAFERAVDIDRREGRTGNVAAGLLNLGTLAMDRHQAAEARARFTEALATFRAAGHHRGAAATLNNLGLLVLEAGEIDEARAAFTEARRFFEGEGDARTLAGIDQNLARVALAAGDIDAARSLAGRALAAFRSFGDRPGMAEALHSAAIIELQAGDTRAARTLLEEALPVLRTVGARADTTLASLGQLAVARARDGDPDGALEAIHEALDWHRGRDAPFLLGETALAFSLVLLACGAAPAAARLAASALVAQERVVPGARRRSEWVGALTRLRVALGDDALGELLREGAATPLEEAMERAESDVFG